MRGQKGAVGDYVGAWMMAGAVTVAVIFGIVMFWHGQNQWQEEQAIQRAVLGRYLAEHSLADGTEAADLVEDMLRFAVGDRTYPTQWPFHKVSSSLSETDKYLISANALALAYRSSHGWQWRYLEALNQETSFLLLASISEGRTDMASQVAMLQGLNPERKKR